jgi:hypothetical protein
MILSDLGFATFSPASSLLALLVSGHVLADFLVQTESVAARKGRHPAALFQHVLLTGITHAVMLLPFWSRNVVVPLLVLSLYHLAVDFTKGRLDVRSGGDYQLRLFFADQGLHAVGLFAVWSWLCSLGVPRGTPFVLSVHALPTVAAWSVVAAGLVFNAKGGTAIVRALLERYPALLETPQSPGDRSSDGEYEMGRTIGVLERLIVFLLVLVGQWGALGLVLAAKSIARFPELKSQRFADYYLMGTLASILTAMATAMVVKVAVF